MYVPGELLLRTAGLEPVIAVEFKSPAASSLENEESGSLNNASVPLEEPNLDFIAKIRPVGPVIGCTEHTSYAIKLGIARLTNEIRIGS